VLSQTLDVCIVGEMMKISIFSWKCSIRVSLNPLVYWTHALRVVAWSHHTVAALHLACFAARAEIIHGVKAADALPYRQHRGAARC